MKVIAYVSKKIELEVDDKFKTLINDFDCDVANELINIIHNKEEIVEVFTVCDETDICQLI